MQWITLPGLTEYKFALEMMESRLNGVIDRKQDEAIFLLEHPDTYTAGSSYSSMDLLDNDIQIIHTGRGGKLTYHGPGQRIIYPILNLAVSEPSKDIKLYIRKLEHWIINTLSRFHVKAYTIPGTVGIWVDYRDSSAKIAAIGVRVKKWVTYHGIAVNINTNLSKFKSIIPCGISNLPVISLNNLKVEISIQEFDLALQEEFEIVFAKNGKN